MDIHMNPVCVDMALQSPITNAWPMQCCCTYIISMRSALSDQCRASYYGLKMLMLKGANVQKLKVRCPATEQRREIFVIGRLYYKLIDCRRRAERLGQFLLDH